MNQGVQEIAEPRVPGETHDAFVGNLLFFPKSYRINTASDSLERREELEIEGDIDSLGLVTLVADIDSLVYISTNFEHVIDACGFERAHFTFSNLINRSRPNMSSRYKLRFKDLENPEFFGRRATSTDFNLAWLPSIPLAEASWEGLKAYICLGILDVSVLRTTNYFTTKQAAVVASAFTYARHHWKEFPEVLRLFNDDPDKLESFIFTMSTFPRVFETQITKVGEISGRKEVKKEIPATAARIFLRAIIAAVRLFDSDLLAILSTHRVNTEEYHGCEGIVIPIDEFQDITRSIMKSGYIAMQTVGIKNQTYNHPFTSLFASERTDVADFYSAAVDQYNKLVKFWLRSNNVEENEPMIGFNDSQELQPWEEGTEPSDLREVNNMAAADRALGDFNIPRCTRDVTVMYDVAISVRANDPESALIVVGHDAAWTMNQLLNFDRLIPGRMANYPEDLRDVYDNEAAIPGDLDLPDDLDPVIFARIQACVTRVIDGDGVTGSSMFELQDVIQALVNDEEEVDEAMAGVNQMIDSSLQYTDIVRAIGKGKANLYPQAVTNGLIGNVHTGNVLLEVSSIPEHEDTENEKWTLTLPPNGIMSEPADANTEAEFINSCIRGGQMYSPDLIAMYSRQTRNYNQDLQKFSAYLMAILSDDESGLYDKQAIRVRAQALWKQIKYIHKNMFFEITMKTSARLELFIEFRDDHRFEDENLHEIGNLLASVQQVNRHQYATYLKKQSANCVGPLNRLLTDDATNLGDGTIADFRNLSACAKAAIVMLSEQAVMITDSYPWVGPMHKRSLKDETTKVKCSAWSLPEQYRIQLYPSTKLFTGLEYGASPDLLRLPHGDLMQPFSDGSAFLRSGTQTNNMFWLVSKKFHHAIQMNQTYYSILCLLQQYSQEEEIGEQIIDLDNYSFSAPPTQGQPFVGTFFGAINYPYIANELDNERRDQLFIKVSLLLHRLYDSFSHYLLTAKNKKRMGTVPPGAPIKLSQFPRTKNSFNLFYKNFYEEADLNSGHLTCGSTEDAIRTVAQFTLHCVNNGSNDRGYKKDPVVFIYNEFVRRLLKIKEVVLAPAPVAHSNIQGASNYGIFTRDHFEFVLCHVFYKARMSYAVNEGDQPILWRVKPSDRNIHLGQAYLFMPNTGGNYPIAPAHVEIADQAILLYRRPTDKWRHVDNFFNSLHHCYKPLLLGHVLVGRLYLNLVCDALNHGDGAETVKLGAVTRAATDYRVADNFLFSYFWSSDKQLHNFLVTSGKIWGIFGCRGLLDQAMLRKPVPGKIWHAVLQGVDEVKLRRRLQSTNGIGNPVPVGDEILEYDMVFDEFNPMSVDFNRNLRNFTIGVAIKRQEDKLVITQFFLQTLMTFRSEWMSRRNDLQIAMETTENEDQQEEARNQCISHSNANDVCMKKLTSNQH